MLQFGVALAHYHLPVSILAPGSMGLFTRPQVYPKIRYCHTHTIITVCFLVAQPVEQFGVVPLRSEYQSVPNIWQNTAHYSTMYPTYHHSLAYRSDTEDVFGIRRVLQYQWPVS